MKFKDNLKTVSFLSKHDSTVRELLVSLPLELNTNKKYPLVISPHPFGFSNFENFIYGTPELLYPFSGWSGLSEKYQSIIVFPLGHGRFYEKISLGWQAQIEDFIQIPEILKSCGLKIDENKLFICGLSMGGMEALTAMGMYPGIFKAGFSFNGVVNLRKWFEDIINKNVDKKLSEMDVDKLVINEVGGSPEIIPLEYDKRSAINYINNLSKANLMIYWSSRDSAVPNQEAYQGKRLYDLIKKVNPKANVFEYDHTFDHGFEEFGPDECIKCHEYNDFNLAMDWFFSNF